MNPPSPVSRSEGPNATAGDDTVAIAVVARDRLSMFRPCLEAVYAHTTSTPFRVVVVAGAADGETMSYLRALEASKGNVTAIFEDHLLTQAEARRQALRSVHERLCVVLENDTIVEPDWLSTMVECMHQEGATVVAPLVLWHRGIHAAGCEIREEERRGTVALRHAIIYTDARRKRIDYPESHCILVDRSRLSGSEIFDDVEPFDVDLGLTLARLGLDIFLEPHAIVTYSAPPPMEGRDVPTTLFRWDATAWRVRNQKFVEKWQIAYDSSAKRASYRRQELRLSLVRWRVNRRTVALTNVGSRLLNWVTTRSTRGRVRRTFG